ncbi:hypothetical protein FB451DRAFT_1121511 [Mycena latifolia]|nr:hypothetical protein FB451DRAFT_1121511 [Mycena latifolia]
MPLFKSHPPPTNEPDPVVDSPTRKGSMFSRRRSLSPVDDPATNPNHPANANRRGGFFGNRANNFNLHKDPTIIAAREKVTSAEQAEAEADRALLQARAMVREAKDHVRFLEREAAAEAKRAQAKQAVSNDVSKSASGLGRHGT